MHSFVNETANKTSPRLGAINITAPDSIQERGTIKNNRLQMSSFEDDNVR